MNTEGEMVVKCKGEGGVQAGGVELEDDSEVSAGG